ncbi:MAG: hypothetical protein COZ85_01490 [Candidatus Moranbacteria bacterium CG_4_8_14_3_um_filter_34_16]|nr:MAG: hypothetical protein COT31_02800 [Candidatus Moranbacteria bacterium CG08_land_8_20_14_0_20_34_16]PIW95139.1 MAG: hypothetical protein COZ85_01490 [Candidatus Moranbacteria bacterium CG_4_8_14_3_um_filter_34_16]
MEEEILKRMKVQEEKIDQIYRSVEKTRKYFLWTLLATIIMFILPFLGIIVAIPWFIGVMSSTYGGMM